jgi:hypothetical protein
VTGDTEIKTHSDTPATTTSLTLKRSRGTTGTPTAVHHGDTLAEIVFQGYDGDTYESASQIRTVVENAGAPVANGQMGGKMFVVRLAERQTGYASAFFGAFFGALWHSLWQCLCWGIFFDNDYPSQ